MHIYALFVTSFSLLFFKVRDEYRTDYDAGRGGYGKIVQQKIVPLESPEEE